MVKLTDRFEPNLDTDKLNRRRHLMPLTNIISNTGDDSFVMTVSAPYGGGKTFFIKLWKKFLEDSECTTLYYNAWENDFSDNPLASFISEFEQLRETDNIKFKEKVDAVISAGKSIGLRSLPTIITGILSIIFEKRFGISEEELSGIVNLACDIVDESEKNIQEINKTTKESLDCELILRRVVENFRVSLTELISTINTTNKRNQYPTEKLIIFIDDLDRCKPDYAIKFLEYIKHLFSVKNCVFILAVDEEQLKSSVEKIYGSKNAEGYLARIVDFGFRLPRPDTKDFINVMVKQLGWHRGDKEDTLNDVCNKSFNLTTDTDSFFNEINSIYNREQVERNKCNFVNIVDILSQIMGLTARDLEHIFHDLDIILKSLDGNRRAPVYVAIIYIADKYSYKIKSESLNSAIENISKNPLAKEVRTEAKILSSWKAGYSEVAGSSLNDHIDLLIKARYLDYLHNQSDSYLALPKEFEIQLLSATSNNSLPKLIEYIQNQISEVFCENITC